MLYLIYYEVFAWNYWCYRL